MESACWPLKSYTLQLTVLPVIPLCSNFVSIETVDARLPGCRFYLSSVCVFVVPTSDKEFHRILRQQPCVLFGGSHIRLSYFKPFIRTEVFRGFPQTILKTSGILPQTIPR